MKLRRDNEWVLRDLGYLPGIERAPRRVDFNLVFPSQSARAGCADPIRSLGFAWELKDAPVKSGTFESVAHRELRPETDPITEAEITLIENLSPVGGYVDGWGFWGDTRH